MVALSYKPSNQNKNNLSLLSKDTKHKTNNLHLGGGNEANSFREGVILGAACVGIGVVIGAVVSNMGGSSKKVDELQSNTCTSLRFALVEVLVAWMEPMLLASRKMLTGNSISH